MHFQRVNVMTANLKLGKITPVVEHSSFPLPSGVLAARWGWVGVPLAHGKGRDEG